MQESQKRCEYPVQQLPNRPIASFTSYDEIAAGCPAPQICHHALRHIWSLSLFPTSETLPEHRTGCQQNCEPAQQALAIAVLISDGSNLLTFPCSLFGDLSRDLRPVSPHFTHSINLQHLSKRAPSGLAVAQHTASDGLRPRRYERPIPAVHSTFGSLHVQLA
jgi:hypothetical protein